MSVVRISRFTITWPSDDLWCSTKGILKLFWSIMFGQLCRAFLTAMGACCARNIKPADNKDDDEVTTPEEARDLESQRIHEPIGQVIPKSSMEATRIPERHSHPNETERLSIGKRNRETEPTDTPNPVQHDGGLPHYGSIKQSEPSPATLAHGAAIKTARRTTLLSTRGAEEASSPKRLKLNEVDIGSPRQQVVFLSPARSRTDSFRSTSSKHFVTPPEGHVVQVEPNLDGSNVTSDQQHRHNEVNHVNDGVHDEVHKPTPNVPFSFPDETSRRFFMSRADAYTEKEIISWSKSLASRISTLSASLIEGIARCKPGINKRKPETGGKDGVDKRISGLLERALGVRLYTELLEAGQKDEELSIDDIQAAVHDSLDAWGTFCIHLAMKPILFGMSPRTIDDVEGIFRQMTDHEQELAQCWKQIRYYNIPSSREVDPSISQLVEDMSILKQVQQKHQEEYAILEQTFARDLAGNEYGRQFAMHWRGLLQKYELGLPSYKTAIKRTEEVFMRGILQIFSLAGIESQQRDNWRDKVEKIVKESATLAERTRTGIFSQTAEIIIVEPGRPFDEETMVSAEGDGSEVKCTLQFGLEVVNCDGQRRVLVQPEVLLV